MRRFGRRRRKRTDKAIGSPPFPYKLASSGGVEVRNSILLHNNKRCCCYFFGGSGSADGSGSSNNK